MWTPAEQLRQKQAAELAEQASKTASAAIARRAKAHAAAEKARLEAADTHDDYNTQFADGRSKKLAWWEQARVRKSFLRP